MTSNFSGPSPPALLAPHPGPSPSTATHQMVVLGVLELESLQDGGGGVPTVDGG